MKTTVKIDPTKTIKRVSRNTFMDLIDTRTKSIPSKKVYKRKDKHKKSY